MGLRAGLGAAEKDCAGDEKRHQEEPGDEGAAAKPVFLRLDQGERAADEDETRLRPVDASSIDTLSDGGNAEAGARLPGEIVSRVRAQISEDSGRRRGNGTVEVAG